LADSGIKISYVAATFRVKVEFTRKAALSATKPPSDLMQKAKAKIEAVQREGSIGFFLTYPERLERIWTAMRDASSEPEDLSVNVTLAAGAPDISGIQVAAADNPKVHHILTIDAPASEVANWRFEWFKLCVARRTRELGIQGPANPAQLQAALIKAAAGEKILALPVSPVSVATSGEDAAKQFSVVANKGRGEIAIVVRDVKPLRERVHVENIFNVINAAAQKMEQATGRSFVVHRKEFLQGIKNAISGPEIIGIDMPMMLLAASTVGAVKELPKPANHPGAHKISVSVSPDKKEAVVTGFSKIYYDDPSFQVNLDWLNLELDRLGIKAGRDGDLMKAAADLMARRESIDGVQVARGVDGIAAKGPFLFAAYKEAKVSPSGESGDAKVDIREMQQRNIVRSGHVVAEIRWHHSAKPGINVFGQEIPPPPDEALDVKVGEGIEVRGKTKFYALADGSPLIEGNSVSLSKAFIHNGDVNLRSGNVRFDGPVEIKGSVDTGAVVDVKGQLIIHGSVRGGFIRSADSIEIKGGVITGPTGKVTARFDIMADFIENSRIVCGGELKVRKAVLNSDVIAGKAIITTDAEGIVAGGSLSCKEFIRTGNLGFMRGAVTEVNVGVDYRIELSIKIRSGRIAKLVKKQNDDRQALREIVAKKREQMTARHEEMKVKLQKGLQKIRITIEKSEAHLEKANANLKYDPNARIFVANLLASNCKITCGGQFVAVANDVAGVGITPRRRRGSFINPIEDIEKEASDNNGDRKAS
jgi:uncharacterized protein (DUF342 family)